jgi:hypothetical protein
MDYRDNNLDDRKLDVSFQNEHVVREVFYRSNAERGERNVRVEEKWTIDTKSLGSGAFGNVRLHSNAHGGKRAVKAVLKSSAQGCGIDYKEEIRTLTKFSRTKSSLPKIKRNVMLIQATTVQAAWPFRGVQGLV